MVAGVRGLGRQPEPAAWPTEDLRLFETVTPPNHPALGAAAPRAICFGLTFLRLLRFGQLLAGGAESAEYTAEDVTKDMVAGAAAALAARVTFETTLGGCLSPPPPERGGLPQERPG